MLKQLFPAFLMKLFMTFLLGIAYPLAVTGLCQLLFPHQANGSLVWAGGRIIGSELIGQRFVNPEYFHSRPSAAGKNGYDATSSGGSNYGPTNQELIGRVKASIEAFRKENPGYTGPIPADLLTASASGLDPHISPDSAFAQASRIAHARGMSLDRVKRLIVQSIEGPDLGLFGEPRINVLKLNLALLLAGQK